MFHLFKRKPIEKYNDDGKLIYRDDRKGNIREYKYDSKNRLVEVILNKNYAEEYYGYDKRGNLTFYRHRNSITNSKFDDKNRVIERNINNKEIKKYYYYDDIVVIHYIWKDSSECWGYFVRKDCSKSNDPDTLPGYRNDEIINEFHKFTDENWPKRLEKFFGKQI